MGGWTALLTSGLKKQCRAELVLHNARILNKLMRGGTNFYAMAGIGITMRVEKEKNYCSLWARSDAMSYIACQIISHFSTKYNIW